MRNEYVHELNDKELEGLLIEVTGLESGNKTLKALTETFKALKKFAKFDLKFKDHEEATIKATDDIKPPLKDYSATDNLKLGLSYTINIVLPKTDDISVFNAIFKSLKENLLR